MAAFVKISIRGRPNAGADRIRPMNPVLDKLTGPPRSLADVADLLESHIGDGSDDERCTEAIEALQKVRGWHPTYYLRAALRELDGESSPCEAVRNVIRVLRKWRHYSGT